MSSLMLSEALEAPMAVARLLAADRDASAELGARLRALDPPAVLTVARGSSDHAAAYLGYLVAARLGRPAASLSMSLVTLYRAPLKGRGLAAFAVSQSGQSPDLVETLAALAAAGALTVAFVNDTASPLAASAEWCFGLRAGAERSVAATKSFIASLAAAARLVGHWRNDAAFLDRLAALPDQLARAARADWTKAVPALAPAG
ncbi:MAG: SIS domain-containing protein, partial [Acetobacteraceae bacterium]